MFNNKFINCFVFLTLGVVLSLGMAYIFKDEIIKLSENEGMITESNKTITIVEEGISSAVSKVYDAVVLIENYKNEKLYSTGTGFIYKIDSKYGYILTNYHVIENNSLLKVILSNDKEATAKYIGGDSYLDVAVLAINKEFVISVAQIGSSEIAKVGDTVFTVGTPIDYQYRGTVTRGILSGKNRLVTIDDNSGNYIMQVLQTDAAMNPGNSGGPLVNINGEVIGINSVKLVEDEIEGMGFSIAIEDIMAHISTLEKGETIKRPTLGVNMYESNNSSISGVVVSSVLDDSSVSNILTKGDIITKLNDRAVNSIAYFRYELYKYSAGDIITITYIRNNETKTAKITLK